ncbi:MAG: hypothetical protein AB8A40_07645 [Prochlorococcus sp.]
MTTSKDPLEIFLGEARYSLRSMIKKQLKAGLLPSDIKFALKSVLPEVLANPTTWDTEPDPVVKPLIEETIQELQEIEELMDQRGAGETLEDIWMKEGHLPNA